MRFESKEHIIEGLRIVIPVSGINRDPPPLTHSSYTQFCLLKNFNLEEIILRNSRFIVRVVVSTLALLLSPSTLLGEINFPYQYQQKINLFIFLLFCRLHVLVLIQGRFKVLILYTPKKALRKLKSEQTVLDVIQVTRIAINIIEVITMLLMK